jgi:enoyl-CoA hydratase/carnithine racemase
MASGHVRIERIGGVELVTLGDAASRNALSLEMAAELIQELDRFDADPSARALVLTGADPSFCSGANVRRFDSDNKQRGSAIRDPLTWDEIDTYLAGRQDGGETDAGSVSDVPVRISRVRKPTIAAVNGYAIGLGMGLALSCDIRIASDRAEFAEAFSRMGLVPGDGSCWQLPKLIGLSNTLMLQYTGDRIDAAEAHRINLVSRVYPHDEMMGEAMGLAERLSSGATYAMSLTKYLVQRSMSMELDESLRLAQGVQQLARRSEDHNEAVKAFLAKRKPEFKGR